MGYIGAEPATSFETVRKDRFTSQTGTTVTLSHTVSSVNDILVMVNSVKQDYTNYSVNGTTLTLGGSLVSADIVEVTYIGRTFQTVSPDTNTITNAMMSDDAVDSAEIVDGAVDSVHTNFVSTSSAAGLQIKGDGTTDGTLQLNCSQNSHGIKIKSPPHSANADYTLTMPNNDGSANEFLQSNGSGVLTWAVPTDTNTVYTHPNHSGEVTSTADGATVVADNIVDEANLKVSNSPTNGYALTAQSGNTGGMTWAEMSGGRSTLLATTTLSNTSTVTYNSSLITSTYDNYMVTVENLQTGSGNVFVKMRLSNNNGSSYEGDSGNDYTRVSFNGIQNETNGEILTRYSTGTAHIGLTGNYSNNGNDAAFKIDGYIKLFTLNSSSYKKTLGFFLFGQPDNYLVYEEAAHVCTGTQSVINNIKIFPSSGNLASGKIKLWGLA